MLRSRFCVSRVRTEPACCTKYILSFPMRTDTPPSETLLFASLERRVSKQTFDTWFRPLTVNSSPGEKVFRFSAPNPIVKDWVMAHYNETITQSLRELSLDHYRVEWCLPNKTQNG